ncbi:MMPL family transporter [Bhargavaea beijingensis]|uniref:MMPL family transporter n=1 Tax=Bhargavaea beijingensis TaxID=426756 RepID=A0ABX9ZCQ4_9BACL|nr:MMPL family transporter [Bhargavaea beijingensis]RSK31894.1 MMPL family transporter [Bhargavaea beijingensis]
MIKTKTSRIAALVLWLAAAVLAVVTMPDMEQLVREKGQITIPDSFQSVVADEMAKDLSGDGDRYELIAVFNSGNQKELTDAQKEEIRSVIDRMEKDREKLGIKDLLTPFDSEEAEAQLASEDGTTYLAQISVDEKQGELKDVREDIREAVQAEGIDTYLTGAGLITDDFSSSTQDGVKKTELIAVVFIVLILIAVFRSPVVPFISLLGVGVSYLVSLGVVTQLVDKLDFPFSNFTQVFLVVILFGIGTDYNILLFTRFKEELSRQESKVAALLETYRTAGKTVLYSGVAVMIGVAVLALAEFSLYQSTSAIGIGVAVLLLVLMTLNPFFMALLGKKMFWPSKKFEGHGDSKLWHFLSGQSVLRPFLALLFTLAICVPFILLHDGGLNYNDLYEVDDKYESKQGINVIEKHFEPGFASPAAVMIQTDEPMDSQEALKTLDELAGKISKVDGVSKVLSPTRPAGERIGELYIDDQSKTLNNGLGDAKSGVEEIRGGLSDAEGQVGSGSSTDLSNVQRLIDGTGELRRGAASLQDALGQVTAGMQNGATGAGEIRQGLATVNEKVRTLQNGVADLHDGYTAIESGLGSFTQSFNSIREAVAGARGAFGQIEASLTAVIESNPDMAQDPNVRQALGTAKAAQEQLNGLAAQLEQMAPQYEGVLAKFREANASLQSVEDGLAALQTGVGQLQTGTSELESGLNEGATGAGRIRQESGGLATGLDTVNDGQRQLMAGLSDLQEKMGKLQSGLAASTEGLGQVSEGLEEAQSYLGGLSDSEASGTFYVPEDVLEGEDFQQALDMYMSPDRKTAKMTVILDVNPFSAEAMEVVQEVRDQAQSAVKGTDLADAELAVGGKSSQNADLQEMSAGDFSRTAAIMLVGIAIVLIFITRSVYQPIFIILSLVLSYFTALGVTELLSGWFLGMTELGWNVPFFSFIMIVALGVDYSIFLMMRYKETGGHPKQAIVDAARHMGSVVISAAIILGGTFAALIPSGILTLIQVAIVVIVGLVLLAFVMMPILLPALIALSNRTKKEN